MNCIVLCWFVIMRKNIYLYSNPTRNWSCLFSNLRNLLFPFVNSHFTGKHCYLMKSTHIRHSRDSYGIKSLVKSTTNTSTIQSQSQSKQYTIDLRTCFVHRIELWFITAAKIGGTRQKHTNYYFSLWQK